ncbi:thioredoxin-dependent thiol peroxidase [Cellvibrio polysaccharolyticus]|uniref:thioredoxin-dependent peroxiredoxin n=1 Tax=Cellvibrio polysaccharolyticus TaxID=2082724 RepID=A0A928V5U4_9GAMM|nr:thioredoxin-dependent thiol peroxidase [Cellvibrio polysaccharolyticus]MBE8717740.1 thioredoxin-dependent thiol peroxidase [Cellvibrio polysaccharolyticus]
MSHPEVNKPAPGFSLVNQRGETISLDAYKGRKNVVLYFYPKASTPGCTTQACGIRDSVEIFSSLDTVVLGVSPDPVSRLTKFIDKYDLNFDLLSDEDHEVASRYGAWGPKKFMGKEYDGILRSTFIIDKEGVLRNILSKVNTKTHDQDVIGYIKNSF